MSDSPALSLEEQIESGGFFKDAYNWYQHKYLYPVIERSFFMLLTLVAVFISATSMYVLGSFLPLARSVPVYVSVLKTESEYARISYLGNREDHTLDANIVLKKYLVKRFVESYESYDYENDFQKLKRNLNFIEQFSSQDALNAYKYYISIRNPKSLILKYRNHTKRAAAVDSVTVTDSNEDFLAHHASAHSELFKLPQELRPGQNIAFVDFTGTESNVNGKTNSRWRAKILFHYSNLVFNKETRSFDPVDLKVLEYQSVEVTP